MAFNPSGAQDCSLEVFGGWVTETNPVNLPPGVSPDCPSCAFEPGSVFTRPALQKVFNPPLAANTIITYGKSFVAPNGTIYNFYLASNGSLYLENLTTSPGTATVLFATFGNLYARSVTAFGREIIAISDGSHGSDVPLQYDGTNLDRFTCDGPATAPTVTNVTLPISTISHFQITNNVGTVTTSLAHSFQVGYLAKITGTGVTSFAITSIVVNNTADPGIATIITNVPNGLSVGVNLTLTGVNSSTIGIITSISRSGGVVTVVTNGTGVLTPGAAVTISGTTSASFQGTFPIATVISAGSFTYLQTDADAAAVSGGSASLPWPISVQTLTPLFFEVLSVPTPTSFTVQLSYPDGTWSGGDANVNNDGDYFVTAVPSPTTFQFQAQLPNTFTTGGPMTATPFGQAAPGTHLCRQSFLTRSGFVTKPSPWVQFTTNGGQYVQVSNLLIGPAYVQARIIEFTGALGSLFYYLPVPGQVNGTVVSTATQVNDNVTGQVLLDFSDNTLYAGIGTSIPGNNTPAQISLDGALGFASYESYVLTWGQRNRVTNLINMGFDAGSNAFTPTTIPGWTGTLSFGSGLGTPRGEGLGFALKVLGATYIGSQTAYEDQTGAPILSPNTLYAPRYWIQGSGTLRVTISSASTGYSVSTSFTGSTVGQFYQQAFPFATPATIPPDMLYTITATAVGTMYVDEGSLIFADDPFTDNVLNVSYSENPQAFDGVTGVTGPADDSRQVMDFATVSDIPYIWTREPGGRLHEVSATGTTLPADWDVNERATNCGVLSAFCLTRSQADSHSSSGGEEWVAWASESGARIFGGNEPWKISQEIQPNWNDSDQEQADSEINMQFASTAYSLNDPVARVLYFFLPLGSSQTPSAIYSMSYRELDTAEQIAFSPPYRVGFSGKLIATDNTRKWSPWYLLIAGGARMYRSATQLEPIFFAGGTNAPFQGTGNVYVLNPNKYTDDDYGQIASYYTTCSLPSKDQEQQLQLGGWRKILAYMNAFVSGVGNVTVTAFTEALTNPWPITCTRALVQNPTINLEFGGGNAEAYRMFFRVQPSATTGTDQAFSLSRFVASFRPSRVKVRGSAQ